MEHFLVCALAITSILSFGFYTCAKEDNIRYHRVIKSALKRGMYVPPSIVSIDDATFPEDHVAQEEAQDVAA